MRTPNSVSLGIVALVASACSSDSNPSAPSTPAITASLAADVSSSAVGQIIYGLTTSDRIVLFSSGDACSITGDVAVTGLAAGESLLGIDVRPATGQLYGLGSSSRLYTINAVTGVATAIGSAPFSPALTGDAFGFDFNPTVDRIRVVSTSGQNLRLHPVTGALAANDLALAFAAADANAGEAPSVVGAAYTNPDNDPATGTTLYDIDGKLAILATQIPPNDGKLNTVGSLGVKFNDLAGFDIAPSGIAYAVLKVTGKDQPKHTCGNSDLFTINLTTGSATRIGSIGTSAPLRGIATPTS
jgi:hypothetical protein